MYVSAGVSEGVQAGAQPSPDKDTDIITHAKINAVNIEVKTTELNQGRREDVDISSSGLVGPAPELEDRKSVV